MIILSWLWSHIFKYIYIFYINPFVVYHSFLGFGVGVSFYSSTGICGFISGSFKRWIRSSLIGVIRNNFFLFLSLCNKFKAYYQSSKIRNAIYNTYCESTQLSAGMFDFYFSVKILNKSYKYIYNCNIPSFNDINCSDYISKFISSLTNGFEFKFKTSGLNTPIPIFNVTLSEPKIILPKTEVIQPVVNYSNNGFSLDNHLHHNFHFIVGNIPHSLQFKILIGFFIIGLLYLIGCVLELILSNLVEYWWRYMHIKWRLQNMFTVFWVTVTY